MGSPDQQGAENGVTDGGKLAGRTAIVTGGAGGLGQAIAETFARAGARVCIADRDADAAQASAVAIGHGAFGLPLDVTDLASIDALVAETVAHMGRIDILVNGAGIYGMEPWLHVTEEDFDSIFAVNVKGLLFMTQAVGAHMVAKGSGSIVNIASASGRAGNPRSVVYSASKMAVISLTQSAALAFAGQGVRVNAIAPGGVLTPMWETVQALNATAPGAAPDADMSAQMAKAAPLGRMSTPADHVGAALFLASDDSGYITGQTLNIDGGLFLN